MAAPTIKDTTINPIIVPSAGSTNPFSNVEVQGAFEPTWDNIYGAGGDLTITLTSPSGVAGLGALSDPNNVFGASSYKFDAVTNTFTEHTYGGPQIGPLPYVRDAVHGLLYTAPTLAPGQTITVNATISFTEIQWDGLTNYPVATHGVPVTVTDPAPVMLQVGGQAPTSGPVVINSGPDTFTLNVSEDAYQGDAQFTIDVDGNQQGGVQTVTASHKAGETQPYIVNGSFGRGSHSYVVNFLNDAYGGSDATDRNLYVDSASYNGYQFPDSSVAVFTDGAAGHSFNPLVIDGPTIGNGPDSFKFAVSEDAYQGDAQFIISLDGKQPFGVQTTTALHAAGQTQNFTVKGDFGPASPHAVTIQFLNDAYGGTASTDRNLYVDVISLNDSSLGITPSTASLFTNGNMAFVRPGDGPDKLVVSLSEDAYQGHAQADVTLDGKLLGHMSVTAPHLGTPQDFTFIGSFGDGPHTLGVNFVNDAYGGSDATDRNLYVGGASLNGVAHPEIMANLFSAGTVNFTI
jgi:hypothetical protein